MCSSCRGRFELPPDSSGHCEICATLQRLNRVILTRHPAEERSTLRQLLARTVSKIEAFVEEYEANRALGTNRIRGVSLSGIAGVDSRPRESEAPGLTAVAKRSSAPPRREREERPREERESGNPGGPAAGSRPENRRERSRSKKEKKDKEKKKRRSKRDSSEKKPKRRHTSEEERPAEEEEPEETAKEAEKLRKVKEEEESSVSVTRDDKRSPVGNRHDVEEESSREEARQPRSPSQSPPGFHRADRHPSEISAGDYLLGEGARYYGQEGEVAGEVQEEKNEEGRRMLTVRLFGTTIDGLLQWGSQGEGACRWHLCQEGSPQELEGAGLVHVARTRKVTREDLEAVGWSTNLQPVVPVRPPGDENADLRDRMRRLEERPLGGGDQGREKSQRGEDKGRERGRSPHGSKEKKAKKKKKKKKRQSSTSSSRGRRDREKKKRERRGSSPASAGGGKKEKRDTEAPRVKPLRRSTSSPQKGLEEGPAVHEEAQKQLVRERFDRGFEGGSLEGGADVFGDELKIRGVAERYPGLLAAEALRGISRMVATDMGDSRSQSRQWAPQMVRYYRQVLSRRISGAMGRELLTHCSLIDAVLEGKIAQALDISLQRIKGLELQAGGTSYQVSQRLEVIPSDVNLLPSRQEMAIIQKERYQETRAFGAPAYPGTNQQGKGKQGAREDRPVYKGKETKGKGKAKAEGKKTEEQRKGT
eukprot:s652_g29.t1